MAAEEARDRPGQLQGKRTLNVAGGLAGLAWVIGAGWLGYRGYSSASELPVTDASTFNTYQLCDGARVITLKATDPSQWLHPYGVISVAVPTDTPTPSPTAGSTAPAASAVLPVPVQLAGTVLQVSQPDKETGATALVVAFMMGEDAQLQRLAGANVVPISLLRTTPAAICQSRAQVVPVKTTQPPPSASPS